MTNDPEYKEAELQAARRGQEAAIKLAEQRHNANLEYLNQIHELERERDGLRAAYDRLSAMFEAVVKINDWYFKVICGLMIVVTVMYLLVLLGVVL